MPPRARSAKDYYAIMGLPREAIEDEIRKAYRRLALRWHPDRNAGDPQAAERFKELSEAYAVLIDPSKRREYDRARQRGASAEFRHTREDLFRDLFADPRASTIFEELAQEFERMGVRVDRHYFHQTLFGGRAVVTGGVFVITPFAPMFALFRLARAAVRGARADRPVTGSKARSALRPGGVVAEIGRLARWLLGLPPAPDGLPPAPGPDDMVLPLSLSRDEAAQGGRKHVRLQLDDGVDEVLVTIPAGIRSGTKLRLRGKGRVGAGGARGDAYLAVEVRERA